MKSKKQIFKHPNLAWTIELEFEKHYAHHITGLVWHRLNKYISAKGNHLRDQIILKLKREMEKNYE